MLQLKQEKIFGFGSYDEFFGNYFKKDLVAVEEMNRARNIANARKKYEMRWRVAEPNFKRDRRHQEIM